MRKRFPYWDQAVWHHGPVRPPVGRRLGSIAGIPIYGRGSALVLPLMYLALLVPASRLGAPFPAFILLMLAATVAAIVLHEAGHAAAGRRAGQQVNYVVLALGGCVEWGGEGDTCAPRTVMTIAAAGPLVNLALFVIPFALLPFTSGGVHTALLVTRFINVWGLLNLVPFRGRDPRDHRLRAGTDGMIILKALRAAHRGPSVVDMLAPTLAYGSGDGRSGAILL